MSNPDWLELAVRRSHCEAWMLGHVFERYRELEGLSPEALEHEVSPSRRWGGNGATS